MWMIIGVDGGPIRCETSLNFRIGPVLHVSAGLKFANVLGVARFFLYVYSVPLCVGNRRFLLSELAISTKFGVMLDEVLTKRNVEKNSVNVRLVFPLLGIKSFFWPFEDPCLAAYNMKTKRDSVLILPWIDRPLSRQLDF